MLTPALPQTPDELATNLKQYISWLRPYAEATGDRLAIALIECADFIMIEGARLKGGDYHE